MMQYIENTCKACRALEEDYHLPIKQAHRAQLNGNLCGDCEAYYGLGIDPTTITNTEGN